MPFEPGTTQHPRIRLIGDRARATAYIPQAQKVLAILQEQVDEGFNLGHGLHHSIPLDHDATLTVRTIPGVMERIAQIDITVGPSIEDIARQYDFPMQEAACVLPPFGEPGKRFFQDMVDERGTETVMIGEGNFQTAPDPWLEVAHNVTVGFVNVSAELELKFRGKLRHRFYTHSQGTIMWDGPRYYWSRYGHWTGTLLFQPPRELEPPFSCQDDVGYGWNGCFTIGFPIFGCDGQENLRNMITADYAYPSTNSYNPNSIGPGGPISYENFWFRNDQNCFIIDYTEDSVITTNGDTRPGKKRTAFVLESRGVSAREIEIAKGFLPEYAWYRNRPTNQIVFILPEENCRGWFGFIYGGSDAAGNPFNTREVDWEGSVRPQSEACARNEYSTERSGFMVTNGSNHWVLQVKGTTGLNSASLMCGRCFWFELDEDGHFTGNSHVQARRAEQGRLDAGDSKDFDLRDFGGHGGYGVQYTPL